MSKIEALKKEIEELDAASAPSAQVVTLTHSRNNTATAIANLDDAHAERIEALQALIKAAVQEHKAQRDTLVARSVEYDRAIEAEKKNNEAHEAELSKRAEAIATKYGKPLSVLRQVLADAS